MMKKTLLMLFALSGASLAMIGCTSNETAQAPQSAQVTSGESLEASAEQSGAIVQADPAAQGVDSIQSAPAAEMQPGQPAAQ